MNKNNKKGAAQGGADNAKDPADAAEQLDYLGTARGYTQNFGPARQSGYQKGAAKVNEIMGKGAAQQTSADRYAASDAASDAWAKKVHGGPKGSINPRGKIQPGFNFFPPSEENKISKEDVQKGKSTSGGYGAKADYASAIYDIDQDGDNVFTDANQDGTMVGRTLQAIGKKIFGK